MSKSSERKTMKDTLTHYPLMSVNELARFLNCSPDHARKLCKGGRVRCSDIRIGSRNEFRVDPLDAAVFHLAQTEGLSVEEFWERHGPEGTPERCARFVVLARKIQAKEKVAA